MAVRRARREGAGRPFLPAGLFPSREGARPIRVCLFGVAGAEGGAWGARVVPL